MDDASTRVLKRKRHTIATHLQLTDETRELFRNSNLLNDVIAEQINVSTILYT